MKRTLQYYFAILFLFSCLTGTAQRFPDEMHFSPDGKKLITGKLPITGFYDMNFITDIELHFSQSNYWSKLESNYDDHDNILARITVNGVVYDSVGVRFKGNSSYSGSNDDKKSFNISMDAYKPGQDIEGYNTFNLNNCMGDPSYMAEILFEYEIRKHVPAAKGNFAHLFINGMDWGIYANIQQLNKDFTKEWFLSNDGALWRAQRPEGSSAPSGEDGDSLRSLYYLGSDTTDYYENYDLKSCGVTSPSKKLRNLCRVMDTVATSRMESILGDYLDIDRSLWFLASEIAFADDDGYAFEARNDYFFYYEEETGRFAPLEMDGNGAMDESNSNTNIFLNANNPNYALSYQLLNNPPLRQRYLAHLRTILDEELNAELVDLVDSFYAFIDPIVQNDPVANYSYSEFVNYRDDLKDFVNDRRDYIQNNSEVDKNLPVITNTIFYSNLIAWQRPEQDSLVYVTTHVTSQDGIDKVTLYHATGIAGKFSRSTMYDDGLHHDQAAGDGTYGATLQGQDGGTWVRFYIEATSDNSAKTVVYDPPGAEHDIYIYLVKPEQASDTSVVVNELMAKNVSAVADSSGLYSDWIELYNNSNQPKNISGFYLTDNSLNLIKWEVPQGTIIPPDGYLILWADDSDNPGPYHTNFKFSGNGEQLLFLNNNLEIINEINFGPQTDNLSYARVPNGTGSFIIQGQTFFHNNNPIPHASFTGINATGCAPLSVTFNNNSSNGWDYLWDFGDNTSSTNASPVHTYSLAGTYPVTLIASVGNNSDTITISDFVSVYNPMQFEFSTDTIISTNIVYTLSADPGFVSYDWSNNDAGQTINIDSSGLYCVTVTDTNACTNSDCVFVIVNAVGINSVESQYNYEVYPSPVKDYLTIASSFDKKAELKIFNSIGMMIYQSEFSKSITIDTQIWSAGIYYVILGNTPKRIIINH